MKSVEIANEIKTKLTEMTVELDAWIDKGTKTAAKRARKMTLELTKIFKEFRTASVEDSKTAK